MKRFWSISIVLLLALSAAAGSHAQSTGRIKAETEFVEAQKSLARGDDKTAEQHLMKALQYDDSFTSAIWQLSQIYEKRGQLEYARELLLRGLQQDQSAAWAREKLSQLERILTRKLLAQAESFMETGKYDLAVPKLSLYLGIKPHDPIPLEMLGRCHLALGNLKTAKEYLVQAVQRDPSNSEITSMLDSIEERMARSTIDAAIEKARKILTSYTAEDKAKAEKALNDVLKIDPGNSWATGKLEEIALLSEEKEKDEDVSQTLGKGIEAIKSIENPVPRARNFFQRYLAVIVFAVAAVLLGLNLKRKARIRDYPLQGSLSLIPILDVVSLLNSNLKTGRLQVSYGKTKGEVFFEKGEIVHSRFKSYDGRSAFHRIMEMNNGKYVFYNHLPNVRHTIKEPLSLLLLSMKSSQQSPGSAGKRERTREKTYS